MTKRKKQNNMAGVTKKNAQPKQPNASANLLAPDDKGNMQVSDLMKTSFGRAFLKEIRYY